MKMGKFWLRREQGRTCAAAGQAPRLDSVIYLQHLRRGEVDGICEHNSSLYTVYLLLYVWTSNVITTQHISQVFNNNNNNHNHSQKTIHISPPPLLLPSRPSPRTRARSTDTDTKSPIQIQIQSSPNPNHNSRISLHNFFLPSSIHPAAPYSKRREEGARWYISVQQTIKVQATPYLTSLTSPHHSPRHTLPTPRPQQRSISD